MMIKKPHIREDILTTRGDIIYRGASAAERLAKGTEGQVLKQGANDPEWATLDGYAFKTLASAGLIWRFSAIGNTNRTAAISSVADDVITLTTEVADQFFSDSMEGYVYLLIRNTKKSENAWVKAYVDADEIQVTDADDISGWENGDTIRGHSENQPEDTQYTDIDLTPAIGENAVHIFLYGYVKDTAASQQTIAYGAAGNIAFFTQVANVYSLMSGMLTLYSGRQLAIRVVAADSAQESVIDVVGYTEAVL